MLLSGWPTFQGLFAACFREDNTYPKGAPLRPWHEDTRDNVQAAKDLQPP